MNEIEKLEGYYNHLKANAVMMNIPIKEWSDISSLVYKDDLTKEEGIEKYLRITYSLLSIGSDKASEIISNLIGNDYKMSSLMTYEQWWRNKQLNKIV